MTQSNVLPFDTSVPNPARMWNYWVGGKDHFAADRQAAEQIMVTMPQLPVIARMVRRFLVNAVHELASEHGIRQFLDIGTGLPTADNTHDVAQRVAPEARIVYVDYDPVVLSHARALLTSSPEGKTDFIQADLGDTETILSGAARTLDLGQPVAVLLLLPGGLPRGQRHRAGGRRGACPPVQRACRGNHHAPQSRAGRPVL